MSIGYSAPNGAVKQALQDAFSHGVVVVASAGNSGAPSGTSDVGLAPESFPADYPGVISVGAVNEYGDGGRLLQRQPVRPGGRAGRVRARPRAGTGSTGGSAAPARPAPWWPGSPP